MVTLVGREVFQVIAAEEARMGEEGRQPENLAERDPRRGESPFRLGQETAVAVEHLHPHTAGIGVRVHELAHLVQRIFGNDGIGVEQQDVLSRSQLHGLVVGPGESHVFGIGDESHLGESGGEVVERVVLRVVVDHEDFGLHGVSRQGSPYRPERLLQKVFHPVVDDDDADFYHRMRLLYFI